MLIENEIHSFIKSEENNGALLITGKWGCGKSYLIKKCVSDLNSREKVAIKVISLFGVDNIAALNIKVRDAYLEFVSGVFGKKAQKIYGALKKVATDSAKTVAAALPDSATANAVSTGVASVVSFNPLNFISVKNTVGKGENQREFVIVFDDFERCNIDIRDLLGAINEYAENKDIKVIIVADETKVSDEAYKEFKEKVVSRTLQMSSDYPQIVDSIVEMYRTDNTKYKEFLRQKKDCIIGAFTHSGYDNLRALKSCLIDFERIFNGWQQAGVPSTDIENVFYKFCVLTYETKKGNYAIGPYGLCTIVTKETEQKKRDAAVSEIKSKYLDGAFDHIMNNISRWVVVGEWDDQKFQIELKQKYLREECSYEEKFIRYSFWDLEQEDVDNGMPVLVERAYKGEASRDEIIALLQKTHALKKYNVSLPCEVDYKKIELGLDERAEKVKIGTVQEPQKHTFTENGQIDAEAIPINEKIKNMENRMHVWENRRLLTSYLSGTGSVSQYSLKSMCIDAFDDELYSLFVAKYLASTNGERSDLCRLLLGLFFNNSHYSTMDDQKTTLKNYENLIATLEKLCKTKAASIDNAVHHSFINHLQKLVSETKQLG